MKKIVLAISMLLLLSGHWQLKAQKEEKIWDSIPRTFIGVGTGINSQTGMIGLKVGFAPVKQVMVHFAAGSGGWGNKVSIAAEYLVNPLRGWGVGFGYSYFPGIQDFEQELDVESSSTGSGKQKVELELLSTSTVNLMFGYHKLFNNRGRFGIDLGFCIGLNEKPYKIKDQSTVLSEESEAVLNMLSPGGIIFGIHYSFGLK